MITRYAFFEGSIRAGEEAAFRAAVVQELVPTWQAFPGILAVRVSFPQTRDEGAPEMALILAVDYPDRAVLDHALASEARKISRATTERLLPRFFTGRIYHHVTEQMTFAPMQ
jgi:hypothetical protein